MRLAERIAGNPGEIGKRQAKLQEIDEQIRKATEQRNAVLAAARKDPTGASIKDMQAEIDQARKDRRAAEADLAEVQERHNALRAAVCPFPKPHEALVAQAARARDRALYECAAALPDGYRLEHAAPDGGPGGYRWTIGSGTWGETVDGPGTAVRQAWQRLGNQVERAHREAVRHAEKRLAELEGPVPLRSVLLAAVETLGWTAAAGDPEDWAHREGAKLAADRKSLSDLRSIMVDAEKREAVLVKERATLIGDLQDIALEVDPGLGGEALLERIRQIVHDAAACEQHRRQVDAIDADLGRVLGERGEGLTLESRLAELAEQRDMWRKAAEPVLPSDGPQPAPDPHGSTKPSPVQDARVGADEADMQRIRDLLHERRVRLAVRDGEACSWPELVRGLVDDFYTAEGDEKFLRRRIEEAEQRAAANAAKVEQLEAQLADQPRAADLRAAGEALAGKGSAADHMRAGWEAGDLALYIEIASVGAKVADFGRWSRGYSVRQGKSSIWRATISGRYTGAQFPAINIGESVRFVNGRHEPVLIGTIAHVDMHQTGDALEWVIEVDTETCDLTLPTA